MLSTKQFLNKTITRLVLIFSVLGFGQALAVPITYTVDPVGSFLFPEYKVSGTVRADKTGNRLTFSSASPPRTNIILTPVGSSTVNLSSETTTIFNEGACLFSLCGGVKVNTTVAPRLIRHSSGYSLDGTIDLDALSANMQLAPLSAPLEMRLTVTNTVQLTGDAASLPSALLDPLLLLANQAADSIGEGTLKFTSDITALSSTSSDVTTATNANQEQISLVFGPTDVFIPPFDIMLEDGNLVRDELLNLFGADFFENVFDDAHRNSLGADLECLSVDPDCFFAIPGSVITFFRPIDNVSVPEPATLILMGIGLAGLGVARKCKSI